MGKKVFILICSIFVFVFISCNDIITENINTQKTKENTKVEEDISSMYVSSDEVLNRLNYYRDGLGLPHVSLSLTLNEGASLHTEYMKKNNIITHLQDPNKPAYNPLGAETGLKSILAGNVNSGVEAVDLWMNSLYHRQYLLNPELTNVGFSFLSGFATMNLGLYNNSSKEGMLLSSKADVLSIKSEPIIYPFDSQKNVPVEFDIMESPNPVPEYITLPTGPFITVTFKSFEKITEITKVSVTSENGKEISIARFLAKNKENILAILPEKPLPYGTNFTVEVELKINLKVVDDNDGIESYTYKKVWNFTTEGKTSL